MSVTIIENMRQSCISLAVGSCHLHEVRVGILLGVILFIAVDMKTTSNQLLTSEATILKRPASARGTIELGWLHSRHTFSVGNYFDPER